VNTLGDLSLLPERHSRRCVCRWFWTNAKYERFGLDNAGNGLSPGAGGSSQAFANPPRKCPILATSSLVSLQILDRETLEDGMRIQTFVLLLAVSFGAAACGSTPGTRAVTGGLIGAGAGAGVSAVTGGKPATGALIGGGVGAVGGAITH
jgi:osmotically inducible lipoprotein OsmB